jgi:phenylacetic acid degradation operon negative regulatory protein
MEKINAIDAFFKQRIQDSSISCKSIIVTVFGDVISQHGGWIWLGSLIQSLQPLGFSERLIRTSVYRLVKEDWLKVKKVGRKSFYCFTEKANNHYTKAARRIYANGAKHSDGNWLIVMPCFVADAELIELKRQLRWLGFSALSHGAFAHPSIEQSSIIETLNELKLKDSVIVFSSTPFNRASSDVLKQLVNEKWSLEPLNQAYQKLIENYQPLQQLCNKQQLNDRNGFVLRILIIHEYRRILLKDHELPKTMLPPNWLGGEANKLVKDLYAMLEINSQNFICQQLENIDGNLPFAAPTFKQRFD